MTRTAISLPRSQYINNLYLQEDNLMKEVWLSAPEEVRGMQISAEEGQLLAVLLRAAKARRILEIGTLVGYSTTWLAKSLLADGKIITLDKSAQYQQVAMRNIEKAGLSNKVEFMLGEAIELLHNLSAQETYKFDAVFIDGQKSSYPQYLELILPMLAQGGLIIADNTLLFDTIYSYIDSTEIQDKKLRPMWEGIQLFNKMLSNKQLFISTILPTTEGLSIAVKL